MLEFDAGRDASSQHLTRVRMPVEHHDDVGTGWQPGTESRQQPSQSGFVARSADAVQQVVAVDQEPARIRPARVRPRAAGMREAAAHRTDPAKAWLIGRVPTTARRVDDAAAEIGTRRLPSRAPASRHLRGAGNAAHLRGA